MASIVALVREECPGAMEINIEGCSDWAVVRAVAECVAETFDIPTSRELYQCIKEMGNGERCAFPRLLERLQEGPEPRLALDPEFKPEAEPQSDEDSDGEDDFFSRILARFTDGGETGPVCAKVMAVLLGVSFDDDEFQCSTSQLHDAAARGDTELVSLLLDAGQTSTRPTSKATPRCCWRAGRDSSSWPRGSWTQGQTSGRSPNSQNKRKKAGNRPTSKATPTCRQVQGHAGRQHCMRCVRGRQVQGCGGRQHRLRCVRGRKVQSDVGRQHQLRQLPSRKVQDCCGPQHRVRCVRVY